MSDKQKKFGERATRLKRALMNEQKKHRNIEDGAGKRYLIGPLFVLAGECGKALAHYDWYEKHCSDDVGEPFHYLYWALCLYRDGDTQKANEKLLETMLQNVYFLPILLGAPEDRYDIWHCSNMQEPEYITQAPPDLLPRLSEQERSWIEQNLNSFRFRRTREEYIATYGALKNEKNIDRRREILARWRDFLVRAPAIDG